MSKFRIQILSIICESFVSLYKHNLVILSETVFNYPQKFTSWLTSVKLGRFVISKFLTVPNRHAQFVSICEDEFEICKSFLPYLFPKRIKTILIKKPS